MTYFFIYFLFAFVVIRNLVTSKDDVADNLYGEGYGTRWIYFPDGDGIPHNVSLTGNDYEEMLQARGGYNDIEFRLFIKNNITDSITLNETAVPMYDIGEELQLSNKPLKIITHGWRSSADANAVITIRDAYLARGDVNVITIDWSYIASSIFYHWVANQTEVIGLDVAVFLNALASKYDVSGADIHLIGHSLGAHVMGIAANHCMFKLSRVTGLDPARPLFEMPGREPTTKLDSSDAEFVDIIHTCAGVLGVESSIGTVDFYPNNGIPPQPGCQTIAMILEACSHGRSYYYFAESITYPKAFPSFKCMNWTEYLENNNNCDIEHKVFMGDGVSRKAKGNYYLKTNSKSPYGQNK